MVLTFRVEGDTVPIRLDESFGRCEEFLVLDSESGEIQSRKVNSGAEASSSAGITTVQTLANAGVQGLFAPHLGPKAEDARKRFGLRVWTQGTYTNVDSALDAWRRGELEEMPGDSKQKGLLRA